MVKVGLAEKRAAKAFETNRFPQLKKEIQAAAEFEVPVEVNWESLMAESYAHLYDEAWPKVYFKPLVGALKAICIDDLGKDALKSKLKKIVIQNKHQNSSGDGMANLQDGVLTLDHEPCSNVDYVEDRAKGIQKTLEADL